MDKKSMIQLEDFDVLFNGGSAEMEEALFSSGNNGKSKYPIEEIKIEDIESFPNHPFKVRDDEEMEKLSRNISEFGVLHPVIVRTTKDDKYQMISGHRRLFASRKIGKSTIPAYIANLSDEEAIVVMTDTNFLQRTDIAISEKAKAYRMRYEAICRQGQRGTGSSLSELGEAGGISKKSVQRLIRLSHLSDALLDMIDSKKLGTSQGVDISYLDEEDQDMVYFVLNDMGVRMTTTQSAQIKTTAVNGVLTKQTIEHILMGEEKIEKLRFSMNESQLNEFFTNAEDIEEIERVIMGLLIKWKGGEIHV